MTFQEFDRLIKATSKYEVFSQFAAAEGSAFLTKKDASFIWEFGRNPSFSTTPSSATKYMGIVSTTEATAPEDPSLYTWSQYKDLGITYDNSTGVPTIIIN